MEVSEEAVRFAKEHFPQVRMQQEDISKMPVKETFDLVICNFVLHWLDRACLLQAVARLDALVKAGGI